MNSITVGLSLASANISPGKNESADNTPIINGASILISVVFWNMNQDIAFVMVMTNPKNINKLKL